MNTPTPHNPWRNLIAIKTMKLGTKISTTVSIQNVVRHAKKTFFRPNLQKKIKINFTFRKD